LELGLFYPDFNPLTWFLNQNFGFSQGFGGRGIIGKTFGWPLILGGYVTLGLFFFFKTFWNWEFQRLVNYLTSALIY